MNTTETILEVFTAEADDSRNEDVKPLSPESAVGPKKRKRWTTEETAMLVTGCNLHGVGNWKTILNDPNLKFDNRSPVDLKDRFRTYFPDAYRAHYPNARTHLSTKVRSTNPDGSPLFPSHRAKLRRPFSPEEDVALKQGYEKYGCVWASIVKDPIFKETGRKSTDLRDRFRNAWPELYASAGYKARGPKDKEKLKGTENDANEDADKSHSQPEDASTSASPSRPRRKTTTASDRLTPVRAATDDQLSGPVRRKRRNTSQGFLRGGTKSVPQSAVGSEDEADDNLPGPSNPIPAFLRPSATEGVMLSPASMPLPPDLDEDSMDLDALDLPLASDLSMDVDDIGLTLNTTQMTSQSHGLDTPTHSVHSFNHWPSSPTSSSADAGGGAEFDYLNLMSSQSSPYQGLQGLAPAQSGPAMSGQGMIGKSAWGMSDWFSPNPRLDSSPSSAGPSPSGSGSMLFANSSPFSSLNALSFNSLALTQAQAQNSGVIDRYDLVNPSTAIGYGQHASHNQNNFHNTLDINGTNNPARGQYSTNHNYASNPYEDHESSSAYGSLDYSSISELGLSMSDSGDFDFDDHDDRSTFSDPVAVNGRGRLFTHHSSYAGDLIFGMRTHQPVYPMPMPGMGLGFGGLGIPTAPAGSNAGAGANASGDPSSSSYYTSNSGSAGGSFHSLGGQMRTPHHTHSRPSTSAGPGILPDIDELELTGISLNERNGDSKHIAAPTTRLAESSNSGQNTSLAPLKDAQTQTESSSPPKMEEEEKRFTLEDLVHLDKTDPPPLNLAPSPPQVEGAPSTSNIGLSPPPLLHTNSSGSISSSSSGSTRAKVNSSGEFDNPDGESDSEHLTPPGTPIISTDARQHRHMRHLRQQSSASAFGPGSTGARYGGRHAERPTTGHGYSQHGLSGHGRSISVPPTDDRVANPGPASAGGSGSHSGSTSPFLNHPYSTTEWNPLFSSMPNSRRASHSHTTMPPPRPDMDIGLGPSISSSSSSASSPFLSTTSSSERLATALAAQQSQDNGSPGAAAPGTQAASFNLLNLNFQTPSLSNTTLPSNAPSGILDQLQMNPGDFMDLSFLDLHYPTGPLASLFSSEGSGEGQGTIDTRNLSEEQEQYRQGQALDLAFSSTSSMNSGASSTHGGHRSAGGVDRSGPSMARQRSYGPLGGAIQPLAFLQQHYQSTHSRSRTPKQQSPAVPVTVQRALSVGGRRSLGGHGLGTLGLDHTKAPPLPPRSRSSMSAVGSAPSGPPIVGQHQRGQSAASASVSVRPQDLLLRSENNQRKRASWDGTHVNA